MLHIAFDDNELPQLRHVLDRAMNTWEPKDQPQWLKDLSNKVDQKLGTYVEPHQARVE